MKFIINSGALAKALKCVSPAIANRLVMPILSNVKCSVDKSGTLKITATDLRLTIITSVGCESDKTFECLLPFKRLQDIVSQIDYPLTIEVDKNIVIHGDKQTFRLGIADDANDYPPVDVVDEGFSTKVDGEVLYYMKMANRCTNKGKEVWDFTHYINVNSIGKSLWVCATDRNQMMIFKKELDESCKDVSLTVDESFVNSLPTGSVSGTLSSGNNKIKFEGDNICIIGTLSDQKHPDYRNIKRPEGKQCKVSRTDLVSAINQMSCLVTTQSVFELEPLLGEVSLKFDDDDFDNHFDTKISANHDCENEKYYLSGNIFKNLLSIHPDTDDLVLSLIDHKHPVYIDTEEKDLQLSTTTLSLTPKK